MKILAIETSCDETAIAILECKGDEKSAAFTILGNTLLSQIEMHKEYGGVFPALAKREHAKNLVPILEAALEEAELLREDTQAIPEDTHDKIAEILSREPGLTEAFFDFVSECEPPAFDAIAVTTGPGLEPALWVGINFARALALLWEKPLVAVNHMEGHLIAALASRTSAESGLTIPNVEMPVLALLVSGGHTELVLMHKWLTYELIGQTRDDAVGEAFDKVARMLALPYPGGPEISRLAETARTLGVNNPYTLPRPMIDSGSYDFSFAGLKTAVLYLLKDNPNMRDADKAQVAREFEDAVVDVLWKKTSRALEATAARTLIIGGGVSANTHLRRVFTEKIKEEHPHVALRISIDLLTTDNAIMIALAGFYRTLRGDFSALDSLTAEGNRSLA
ncbi:MAG: tRNA (adenosine(37)-N6)-threonylcarbamoyltransferase complex transferase subunit TsaD [Minisyncoccota bacterium]